MTMLIQTKLTPPHNAVTTLSRHGLVNRIVASASRPLTMINAPAGYGKTTLLGQCYARWKSEGMVVGWYSVDDRRFESEQFFAYVMYALHRAGLPLPYSEQAITGGLSGVADITAANALLLALEASEEPVRLIIDDYHRIASPSLNAFISHVIERLPGHAAVILSTRGEAELPIASLKARGQILNLNQREMRFTEEEAAAFFEPGSKPSKWRNLIRDTEGWPAVLQLLRIRGGSELASEDVRRLAGSTGDLASYLAEQIFIGLPEDLQSFLLDVAWVSEACGGLADALTGRHDGHAQLERLARMNLFVTPVDDRGNWYRFHPLLSEFLMAWLSRTRPEQRTASHERVARWYVQAGMLANAVEHAMLLPDRLAPLEILEEAKGWRLALQGGLSALRHLDDMHLSHVERFPRVWLARCYLASHKGNTAEARSILDHIASHLAASPEIEEADPELGLEVLAVEVVTLLYEGKPIPPAIGERIEAYLNRGVGHAFVRTVLRHLLCAIAFSEKDHARCHMHGEEALRGASMENMPFTEAYSHQYMGLSRLEQGRVHEAEISLRRAASRATKHFGDGSAPLENTRVLLARAHYLRGDRDTAEDLLAAATENIERAGGWHDTFVAAYETRAWLWALKGDFAEAQAVLVHARRIGVDRQLPRLVCLADIWDARIQIFRGSSEEAMHLLERAALLIQRLDERNTSLEFALGFAQILAGAVQGDVALAVMEGLQRIARRLESMACHLEASIARALIVVHDAPRDAILSFREALDLSMIEGLSALLLQCGQSLAPLGGAAMEFNDLLAPAQRVEIGDLFARNTSHERHGLTEMGNSAMFVTPREREVLHALADGLSSKEIARRLGVAESTIKTHRINIYRKLGVTLRSKAIESARHLHLI